MSGIMSALSSAGTSLTAAGAGGGASPLMSLLSATGVGTNIFSGVQQMQEQQRLAGAQKYITNLTENPTKMAAAEASFQQPLSAGLTSEVANTVQGNLAERGLGSSPAAYTQALTQSIAPYVQQNQSTALQALMQSLGLLGAGKSTASPMMDISKLLAQLKIGGGGTGTGGGGLLSSNAYLDTENDNFNPAPPSSGNAPIYDPSTQSPAAAYAGSD